MAAIPIVEDNRNLASFEARILREAGHTPILAAALADQPAQAADEEAQAHRHQRELIGQLIVHGSDALVLHVHRRLCADRMRKRGATPADPPTWTEIAEWGKHERLLDAEQARLLRRLQAVTPKAARRATA